MPWNRRLVKTDAARAKEELRGVGGDWFAVLGPLSDLDLVVQLDQDGDAIPVAPNVVYRFPFRRLFVTHAAGISPFTIISGKRGEEPALVAGPPLPNVFKNATPVNGGPGNDLWAPAAGKRIRLLRYCIEVSGNTSQAVAGSFLIEFYDQNLALPIFHRLYIPGAAGTNFGGWTTGWVDLGMGVLLSAADRVLRASLTGGLTSGVINVQMAGREE